MDSGRRGEPCQHDGTGSQQGAEEKILSYIEKGKSEGRLITGGVKADGEGYFIRPTVIADVNPKATIAQEEIFGPVLAIIKAKDFDHALAIANDTEFGSPAASGRRTKRRRKRRKENFTWGIFISIGRSPGRWSACIRSAVSICPERIRKPEEPTTCNFSCRQSPLLKR